GDQPTPAGGRPPAAAAARAVLRVMQEEDVPTRARAAGDRLGKGLEAIPAVADVRGLGLLLATRLDGVDAKQAAAAALDAGLVVNPVSPTALRFAPSLLVSDDEIDEALGIVVEVLEQ